MAISDEVIAQMTPDILDTREAAAYIRLAKPTLERFRLTGDGPRYAKMGKAVRYRRTDLDEWLASRLIRSTSQQVA
jgi:excisionase family DNA binding protein